VTLSIRSPRIGEAALVLGFVREAADYATLLHEVDATEATIAQASWTTCRLTGEALHSLASRDTPSWTASP
jgi:hypothetical protein